MDNVICWISMTSYTKSIYHICQCLFMLHFLGISPVCPPQLCKTQLEPATTPQTDFLFPTPPHECHPTRFYGSVKMPRRPIANPLPAKVLIVVHLLVCKYHSWHSWYYPRCSPQWCNREKSSHPMGSMTVCQWLLCLLWSCNRIGFANLIPVVEFSKFSDRLWIVGRRTQHPFWFRHTPFLNRACEPWLDHDPLAEQQPPFLTRFSTAGQRVPIIAQRHWNRNQILAQLLWPHCKSIGATTSRTPTPKRIVAERSDEWN